MAVFGLPGGAELLVIAAVALLLFVPGVAVFFAGFFLGKKSGSGQSRPGEDVSAADRETMDELESPVDEPLPEDQDHPSDGEKTDG